MSSGNKSLLRSCFAFVLLLLAAAQTTFAQRATGSILGTVFDRSGAVVPAAAIKVVNAGTRITSAATTNASGNFLFPSLPAGEYELTVSAPGFKKYVAAGIVLDVDANQRHDATLDTGNVQETVEVVSQAPLVNTDDASVAQTVNGKLMTDLLLNGRDYQQLQLLSPGAVSLTNFQTSDGVGGGAANFTSNGTVIVANGGRPGKTGFLIDGSDNYDYRSRTTTYVPTLDAIAEFKHQKSQFSAEYGFGGSAVSVVMKSGTNAFHGTAWEFLRNNAFDARYFFSAADPDPLKRNQFGANIGGPVRIPRVYDGRSRTFFFVNYEGLTVRTARSVLATVPSAAFRAGDFSGLANRLFDPATTRPDPSAAGRFIRDPFPNNRIPASRVDPSAAYLFQFLPLPNQAGTVNNYFSVTPNRENRDQYMVKIDHHLSPLTTLMGRYSRDLVSGRSAGPLHPYLSGSETRDDSVHDAVITLNHAFGTATILEARASYSRVHNLVNSLMQQGEDHTAAAGITGFEGISSIFPGVPDLGFTGYTGLAGGSARPLDAVRNNFAYAANLSLIRGSHSMKVGTTLRWYQQYVTNGGTPRGSFSFNGTYTTDPLRTAGTGDGIADFVLGLPFTATRYRPPGWMYPTFPAYGFYMQDDWRVSPRLTLNLGLRYELHMPFHSKYDQFSTFVGSPRNGQGAIVVPTQESISNPTMDAVPIALPYYQHLILTAEQAGISRGLRSVDTNNWAPRIGFAFRPWGSDHTVFRGGYGIYHMPFDGGRQSEWYTVPFIVRETSLSNTAPVPTRTTRAFYPPGSTFDPRPTITAQELDFKIGYMQQWSFGIQRRLPFNMVIDTSYVGAKGTHLERVRPINDPVPGPGNVEARRPYPDFRGISYREGSASSIYHSLQIKLERRWSSGLQMIASYTQSKLIDDGSGDGSGVLDFRNLRLERGLGDYDVPQRFTASPVYTLPFFAASRNALTRNVLGGWTMAGIMTLQSGLPFTPVWTGAISNTGIGAVRPVRIGSGKLDNPTIDRWFDLGAFAEPQQFTFGNSGRNILRMDGISNFDLAMYKDFRITESARVQFRAEAFNAFNHADFGPPVATVNSPTAGTVRTASPPRIMQFALKLYY